MIKTEGFVVVRSKRLADGSFIEPKRWCGPWPTLEEAESIARDLRQMPEYSQKYAFTVDQWDWDIDPRFPWTPGVSGERPRQILVRSPIAVP